MYGRIMWPNTAKIFHEYNDVTMKSLAINNEYIYTRMYDNDLDSDTNGQIVGYYKYTDVPDGNGDSGGNYIININNLGTLKSDYAKNNQNIMIVSSDDLIVTTYIGNIDENDYNTYYFAVFENKNGININAKKISKYKDYKKSFIY